ncbi:DUF933 domain-containing protein [Acidobacteriota bacterium]
MNFTLFGYQKTGKTTLFNLLTGANIETKAFEDRKKEPNLRTCPVPDTRLEKLWAIHPDKEKKPATIDYIDLRGLAYGEIKQATYLSYLRKADGLTHVVRGFTDIQIPSSRGTISSDDDILSMEEELILTDLLQVESRLEKLEKELKTTKNPEGEKEKEILELIRTKLEEGQAIRELSISPQEDKQLRSFAFLSQKPLIHMINVDEKDIHLFEKTDKRFSETKQKTAALFFCGKIEMEIRELEDEEKELFLIEYGLQELSAPKFLRASYELLNVITFFTIGKDEVKAWTIPKNTTAFKAAGAIHSDIEKGFIKAEVISTEDLLKSGSFQTAKENASVRIEGKDYVVQDGDVIYFRFSK